MKMPFYKYILLSGTVKIKHSEQANPEAALIYDVCILKRLPDSIAGSFILN